MGGNRSTRRNASCKLKESVCQCLFVCFLLRHQDIMNNYNVNMKPLLTWLHTYARSALCAAGHSSGYTPAPSHYSNLRNTQLHTGLINSHHLNVSPSPDLLSYSEWLLNINRHRTKNNLEPFHSFSRTRNNLVLFKLFFFFFCSLAKRIHYCTQAKKYN